jgi:hypothetical protein
LSGLSYSQLADMPPNHVVAEHEQIATAVEAGMLSSGGQLGAEHTAQLELQIQSYPTRASIHDIAVCFRGRS